MKDKVQSLIDKYTPQLAANGVKIAISKKYYETKVLKRTTSSILDWPERIVDKKREQKHNHVNNRYHCLVLTVCPVNCTKTGKNQCKDYAFILTKKERPHIGEKPHQTQYNEVKLLTKIESRIIKILKRSTKHSPEKVCRDTLFDVVRYTASKYGYKKYILGKDRSTWDLFVTLPVVLFALFAVLVGWLISILL